MTADSAPAGPTSPSGGVHLGTAIDEAVRALVAACDPSSIILFGSQARGEARPGSDIDLLVVIDDESQWARVSRAALKAVARLHAEVDVVVTTEAKLAANRDTPGTIARPALREGTVVYRRAA